jgi:xylose isomerase
MFLAFKTYFFDELIVLGDEMTDSVSFAICMFVASSGMFITVEI